MNMQDNEVDVLELLQGIWKKKWFVILATLALAGASFAYSFWGAKQMYTSTTRLYIVNKSSNTSGLSNQDLQAGSALTKDYREVILSDDVLDTVISDLDLTIPKGKLRKNITVTIPTDTRIISVSVSDRDASMAAEIANDLRKIGAKKITEVTRVSDVTVLQEAKAPTSPSSPNIKKNVMVGAFAGLFGSVLLCVVIELVDTRVKRREDIERMGITILGTVPMIKVHRR